MTNSDLEKLSKRFAISDDVRRLSLDKPQVVEESKPAKQPKPATKKNSSELERKFMRIWDQLGGPELSTEYRFHQARKWRFDFAHFPSRVAVEIEGGIWSGGRHTRGYGFENDAEKYLSATLLGWVVFRLTGRMITGENLADIIAMIKRY